MEQVTGHGEHGHSQRQQTVTIVINGREKEVPKNDPLTFDELVALAFENPPTGEFICLTITYRKGHDNKPEATVAEGSDVKPKEGMFFNVSYVDKS